jgi:hypothetical protein
VEQPKGEKPIDLVRWALGADPSLRWLRGLIGILAAGLLVGIWFRDPSHAMQWSGVILGGMLVLRIFAAFQADPRALAVVTWLFTGALALVASAFFFDWPPTAARRLGFEPVADAGAPVTAAAEVSPPHQTASASSDEAVVTKVEPVVEGAPSSQGKPESLGKPERPLVRLGPPKGAATEAPPTEAPPTVEPKVTAPALLSGHAVRRVDRFWWLGRPVADFRGPGCIELSYGDVSERCSLYMQDQSGPARCTPTTNIQSDRAAWKEVPCP